MSRFNAKRGLIIIRAELFGPTGSIVLQLAFDTGATGTMVNVGLLGLDFLREQELNIDFRYGRLSLS